jgi:hypothetical protein
MSRGLGAMQRRILETLDEARAAMPKYRGVKMAVEWSPEEQRIRPLGYAWVEIQGKVVRLAPGVYDLRGSAAYLAERDGHVLGDYPAPAFTASFARATHGLVQRRLLVRLRVVPVDMWVFPRHAQAEAVLWPYRQLRFVTLSVNPNELALRWNRRPEEGGIAWEEPLSRKLRA